MPNNIAHQLESQLDIHLFEDDTLYEVVTILWQKEVCAVPILNRATPPMVVGVVSNRDVAICCWAGNKLLSELTAGQAMQTGIYELYDDDSTNIELQRLYGDIIAAHLAEPVPTPPGPPVNPPTGI
jgi:hypothetical protein